MSSGLYAWAKWVFSNHLLDVANFSLLKTHPFENAYFSCFLACKHAYTLCDVTTIDPLLLIGPVIRSRTD